ncbi:hypothetical protein NFI96_031632 [Prochilodus magdalenae]|nr:hypothetical protein NFI96_031632 [Prochilodus magdalenae]
MKGLFSLPLFCRGNDCEGIWRAFEQAYVGKDPCDVPAEAYDSLIHSVTQHVACGTMLFWSKTNSMAHAFTDNRECLSTLEDTLLGFMFDGLTWCSRNGSQGKPAARREVRVTARSETFTTELSWLGPACQGRNPVRSFLDPVPLLIWDTATSCGNRVPAMLNGIPGVPVQLPREEGLDVGVAKDHSVEEVAESAGVWKRTVIRVYQQWIQSPAYRNSPSDCTREGSTTSGPPDQFS